MEIESLQQILKRRKEIEQELMDMLKETESDFTLDHVRDVIFHEEDNDGHKWGQPPLTTKRGLQGLVLVLFHSRVKFGKIG